MLTPLVRYRVETIENWPMTKKEAAGTDTKMALSDQSLKLAKTFIEVCKIFFYFSLRPGILKMWKLEAHGHKVMIQFYIPSKKYSSGDPVPLKILTKGRIQKSTISFRSLGIIVQFLRLEVSTFGFGLLQNAIHCLIFLYRFLESLRGSGHGFLSGFPPF